MSSNRAANGISVLPYPRRVQAYTSIRKSCPESRMASPTVDDERAIRAIVGACEAAWNEGDAAAFTAEMAEDVDFINVVGEHHQGRATVERGHRHIFDTIYKE